MLLRLVVFFGFCVFPVFWVEALFDLVFWFVDVGGFAIQSFLCFVLGFSCLVCVICCFVFDVCSYLVGGFVVFVGVAVGVGTVDLGFWVGWFCDCLWFEGCYRRFVLLQVGRGLCYGCLLLVYFWFWCFVFCFFVILGLVIWLVSLLSSLCRFDILCVYLGLEFWWFG